MKVLAPDYIIKVRDYRVYILYIRVYM